jgi:hypothetical protein
MKQLFTIALLSLMLTNQIQSGDAPVVRTFLTRCLTCINEQGVHENIFAPCGEVHITVRYPEEQEERILKEVFGNKNIVTELCEVSRRELGNREGITLTISLND